MAYSQFSLKDIKEKLNIQVIENQRLFDSQRVQKVAISDHLKVTLAESAPLALAINTEKSRSEWIIAPILAELRKQLNNQISLFSGSAFNVDASKGLEGQCDYIVSLNPEQFYITAPVLTIIEAKKENIVGGLGQCIAALYAAQIFNQREGNSVEVIYGAVTSGTVWKFIKLVQQQAYIDLDEYYLKEIEFLMGILVSFVNLSENNLSESVS